MSTTAKPSGSGTRALAIDAAVVERLLRGFIGEEVRKVGYERAILGLSGGIDSAVTAALAVRALGAANVIPVLLPYRTSSPASEQDAREVCAHLGLAPEVADITPQIDAYFERHPEAANDRRGNKMARERMTVLYDLSVARHALVLGTSNKTELLLGYGTVHGDIAHALNPLGDLYKTQVFRLAEHLGLPRRVIDKPPSADLWEGQSDEADLGHSYAQLDAVLHGMVDERRTRVELLAQGLAAGLIDEVGRRVRTSQYKRRPPLIAKVSARTIDREFRYPRDWGH